MTAKEASARLKSFCNFPTFAGDDDVLEAITAAIAALDAAEWHDLRKNPEDMPPEHDSIFRRFHGTAMWSQSMCLTCSDRVDVTIEFADGSRRVESFKTWDGAWHMDRLVFKDCEVIAWRPRSQPYDG